MKLLNGHPTLTAEHLSGADGIRGLAVLIVLITHSITLFFENSTPYLSGTGKIGVWLFFVLSSFLLANKFFNKGFSKPELISYIFGRAIRILPMFYIAIIIYLHFGYFNYNTAISIAAFKSTYAHLWTIPVEFKFYFILPLVALLMFKVNSLFGKVWLTSLSIIALLAHQYFYPYYDLEENSISMIQYAPSFFIGIYTCILFNERNKDSHNFPVTLIAIFILLAMMSSAPGVRYFLFNTPMQSDIKNQFIPFSILWGVFIYYSISAKGYFGVFIKSILMRKLGNWSFSIYLFHWLIFTKLSEHHNNSYRWIIFSFLSSILVGSISFYLIESPIERFRHSIMNKLKSAIQKRA
ncbi:acyltransferase family protein [Serratia fonticola]|uniref:acyltransferase family protein n=1 Tax=Serratia fonticola TaxID=47917 RepID=UPI000938DF6F|nr:acyltransferase [Serratia fonticola]OKP27671.1 hypothetical protein BSQ40_15080 [Serratia fonticola]